MNPTVSESNTSLPEGSVHFLVQGSKVANSLSSHKTFVSPESVLNSVDFPALV